MNNRTQFMFRYDLHPRSDPREQEFYEAGTMRKISDVIASSLQTGHSVCYGLEREERRDEWGDIHVEYLLTKTPVHREPVYVPETRPYVNEKLFVSTVSSDKLGRELFKRAKRSFARWLTGEYVQGDINQFCGRKRIDDGN